MVEIYAKESSDEEEIEQSRMTLGEHLEELRSRLVRSCIVIAVCFAACWGFRKQLDDFVQRPYDSARTKLNAELLVLAESEIEEDEAAWKEWYEPAGYPEVRSLRADRRVPLNMKGDGAGIGFIYYMKVCLYFALAIGGPFMLWEMWQFIAAGLYRHERGVVYKYFPISVGLFGGGVIFGFLVMVPAALYFLALQTVDRIQWFQSIDNYWTMIVNLTLALGLVFQLPVLMLALARLGLVEPSSFARFRGHTALGALVLAAVLTPPEPVTQMLMAGPIIVLYEIGIWVSRLAFRKSGEDRT